MSENEKTDTRRRMPLGWKIALWVLAGLVTLGLTVAAVLSVLALFNIGTVISSDSSDDSEYTACGGSTPGPVTRLTIEWVAGDVSIIPTSDDEMSFTETWDDGSEVEEADALRWSLKEDALYIKYTKRVKNLHFEQGKRLTVKVPTAWMENMYMVVDAVSGSVNVQVNADLLRINGASADVTVKGSCETLQIYTASGTVQVTGAADELTVHSASGDVSVDGQFGAADLDTASGQIRFNGSADELEIEETSGRVTLTLTAPAKTLEIDTVSGPVTVFLPDTLKGFVLDADTASADVNVHDFDVTVKKDRYTFGDGSMKFEFDSTSGDLNVYRAAGGAEGN